MINFLSLLPLVPKVLLCKTLFHYPHPFSLRSIVLIPLRSVVLPYRVKAGGKTSGKTVHRTYPSLWGKAGGKTSGKTVHRTYPSLSGKAGGKTSGKTVHRTVLSPTIFPALHPQNCLTAKSKKSNEPPRRRAVTNWRGIL
jgi:hypothetical protein